MFLQSIGVELHLGTQCNIFNSQTSIKLHATDWCETVSLGCILSARNGRV